MSLGTEVSLSPRDIVLDGDQLPKKRGTAGHHLWLMSIVAKQLDDQDATWYGGMPRPRPYCVRWAPSSPEGAQQPPLFGPVYCGPMVAHLSNC